MSNTPTDPTQSAEDQKSGALGSATYEIIRNRLSTQAKTLGERIRQLDARRQEVFGSVESKLLQAERINTVHNCIPRDLVPLGDGRFLFGFNVRFGLKKTVELGDVFAIYQRDDATGTFKEQPLTPLEDPGFLSDFQRIYTVYEKTVFAKFSVVGANVFMVFQTGTQISVVRGF